METFTTVSMQYCLNAGYLGLNNRQQVGVTSRVFQPTTGWGYTTDNRLGLHLFPYRRRHGALCTCCASEPVQTGRVGIYNRQQVGFTPFCWLSRVIQPTTGWGYTFFRTATATELEGLCKQHCLDAVYLGLYNRQQVGVRLFPYRRRHCRLLGCIILDSLHRDSAVCRSYHHIVGGA